MITLCQNCGVVKKQVEKNQTWI